MNTMARSRRRGTPRTPFRCGKHDKEAFRTRDKAVSALIRHAAKPPRGGGKIPCRVYEGSCGYWHLTSMPL
jgi:hypothetical protein